MSKSKPHISILLPTRGRKEALKRSLESLISQVSDAANIEILLGVDEDDAEVLDYIKTEIGPMMSMHKIETRASIFKPLGYENLHVYVNTLASYANGSWLFFWNDDAIMDSKDWDLEIIKHNGEFKLLAPTDNHGGHPYAIFPIVPHDWFTLIGHLSQNTQNDAWLSHIAYMLDIFERVPVMVTHDRADITGNNNDETFASRRYMEGNPEDPRDFGHQDMQNARIATAKKIAWYFDRTGQDTTWWNNVITGNQNAFEKMKWPETVVGGGQLAAINSDAGETVSL